MRVLSIDWDYFVEEDPMLDFGHRESMMFLHDMWNIRRIQTVINSKGKIVTKDGKAVTQEKDLTKMLPYRGSFWDILALPCLRNRYQIAVAESHVAILQLLKDKKDLEIINIDAHHDIHYGNPASEFSVTAKNNVNEAECGNWGSYLVNKGLVKKWVQIYPEWRKKFPEPYDEIDKWMREVGKLHFWGFVGEKPRDVIRWGIVDLVFICRSGCWTPPEYDEKFNEFCQLIGVEKPLAVREIWKPE